MTLVASPSATVFGQPTRFYLETLRNHSARSTAITSLPSRRSDKRVSLVRKSPNNTAPPMPVVATAPSTLEAKKKKKSVRFSENVEQVRLFYQWEAPHEQQLAMDKEDGNAVTTAVLPPPPPRLQPLRRRFMLESIPTTSGCHRNTISNEPIQLERILVTPDQVITGQCRVVNLAFEKHVMVRYSLDNWATFHDMDAVFQEYCSSSDLFGFEIPLPDNKTTILHNKELQLSLRYCVNGFEFWDNNQGQNYRYRIIDHAEPMMETMADSRKLPVPLSPSPKMAHHPASGPEDRVSYQYFYRRSTVLLRRTQAA